MSAKFDVLAIGNAIVDVIARVDDDLLAREGIAKGAMTLIDEPRAAHLLTKAVQAVIMSGGSSANTVAGLANLGARAAYIGKVRDDALGADFARDIQALGVAFHTSAALSGAATASCFVMVTPDGQRSMSTYLGACQNLTEADVEEADIAAAEIVYLEGYLWDPPAAKQAFVKASRLAHAHKRRVALSLSDAFCVERYRDEFLDLIRSGLVDIVFANDAEARALYKTDDLQTAIAALRLENCLAIVTHGAHGSHVVTRDATTAVPAAPIAQLVDTTGAGDLYAAGFMLGLAQGRDHATCATLGGAAAAVIIQQIGARAPADLRTRLRELIAV